MFCLLSDFLCPKSFNQKFVILTSKTINNFNGFDKICRRFFDSFDLQNNDAVILISPSKPLQKLVLKEIAVLLTGILMVAHFCAC
jgi:hypothetical protein